MDSLFSNIHTLKSKTPSRHIKTYFKHLIRNHYNQIDETNEKEMKDHIFQEYLLLNDYCTSPNNLKDEKYIKANQFLNAYIIKVFPNCDFITPFMNDRFTQLPVDKKQRSIQIKNDIRLMKRFNCNLTPIYLTYVYESIHLNPSVEGYLSIAEIETGKGNYLETISAYENAINLSNQDSTINWCQINIAINYYQLKQYKKAFKIAKEIEGEYKGKAMKICGDCVAVTAQFNGESSFERDANYWLATDYYKKSIEFGEQVNKHEFSELWPTESDCFKQNVEKGTLFLCKSWGEKIIIR